MARYTNGRAHHRIVSDIFYFLAGYQSHFIIMFPLRRGRIGQPVLVFMKNGTWHPGTISLIIQREAPLAQIDLNQHVEHITGTIINAERPRSEARLECGPLYQVTIDFGNGQQHQEIVDHTRLAIFFSAEALFQKYPVGTRAVGK